MNLPLSWKMQCLHTAAVGCATVPCYICYWFYLWSGVEWETSNATFLCVGLSVGLGVCGETCCMCITVCIWCRMYVYVSASFHFLNAHHAMSLQIVCSVYVCVCVCMSVCACWGMFLLMLPGVFLRSIYAVKHLSLLTCVCVEKREHPPERQHDVDVEAMVNNNTKSKHQYQSDQ